ncbi:MAG TPA: TetR/AcrR family transcriptional regulator [Candidatus Janibacter merdipullorum]|nr:TetR/AcrR family transcriptional regulator [Candidatus Janibacter merdipullorum]
MSDVPDFFRRLWRLPEPQHRRGRRSTLDVETVVGTAVRLADAGGLEAATLPKVADELGVTAMSLYRHVGSKHELLMLMVDAATEPPSRTVSDSGWREGLRQWAVDLWSLYQERPWLPRVPVYRAPSGPHQIAWLEQGFEALSPTDLDWGDQLMALTTLSGFVRQSALLRQELEQGREPGQGQSASERAYGEALLQVVDPERFPRTAATLRSPALGEAPETADHDFTQGLELLLDGLAVRIGGDGPDPTA